MNVPFKSNFPLLLWSATMLLRNEKKGSGGWGCCGYVRVLMIGLDTFSSSGEKRESGNKHMGHYVGLGGDVVLGRRRLGVV